MTKANVQVDAQPFAGLLNKPEDFALVCSRLEHMIMESFGIDAHVLGTQPQITKAKIKHRFHICEKWFRIMRGDMGFGLIKTLDILPKALACELLDQEFDPAKEAPAGRGWSPTAGQVDRMLAR